jgi:DNA-binding NarL/FixJ family response regulator
MNRRELLKALSAIPLSPMVLNGWKAWAHGSTINPARKPQQQVRLVIADDHKIIHDGLRYLLEPDYTVIGDAFDGAEAVELVRQLKPDILLLDDVMPRYNGMYALRELSTRANPTPVRVILFPVEIWKSEVVEALHLGARGVVPKVSATQTLLNAIQTVMADGYWVDREQVSNPAQYLRTLMQSIHDEEARRKKKFGLIPRELEIVSAVVAGYSNKEIARFYNIPDYTVKYHLSKIFDKLGVSTRIELALFAVNQGLPLKPIV